MWRYLLMLALDPKAQISSSTEVNTGVIEIPAIMPSGFDTALWQLLQDIKAAGIPLRGKIAEYAGFYRKIGATITTEWDDTSDNGVNPDLPQTGTSQPNKSLDKLTFLTMFRLPFQGEVVEVSPALTDPGADLYNNRRIVKKVDGTYALGAFHEVLNSSGKVTSVSFQLCAITRPNPITNFEIGGKDLFYDETTNSFYVYGPYVSNFGDPLASTGSTWSKRANDIRAAIGLKRLNGAGEQVMDIGGKWEHVDNTGKVISFDYNTPDTANAYAYYEINFNNLYPGRVPAEFIPTDEQETITAIKTLPLYYFLTIYTENRPWKRTETRKNGFDRRAHFPENMVNPLYSNTDPTLLWRTNTPAGSGLTFGAGLDIGGSYYQSYVYKVEFTIKKQASASGNLEYADRSEPISLITNVSTLKSTLSKLIGINENQIGIEDLSSHVGYDAGWKVEIERGMYKLGQGYYKDEHGYHNVYSHELTYIPSKNETPSKALIEPTTNSARYKERTALPSRNLQTFKDLLNKYFSSNDYANPHVAVDGPHLPNFNEKEFNDALALIFGLLGGPAGVIYWNNQAVFNAFQMPWPHRTIIKNYEEVFSKDYYTKKLLDDKVVSKLELGAQPNVVEKTLFASIQYATPVLWLVAEYKTDGEGKPILQNGEYKKNSSRFDPGIKLALSSHNQYELINVFKNRIPTQPDRRNHRIGYVKKFQHILYRGVEA